MADVMTPEQRSRCMSKIKGRDTGPELRLRRALWAAGFRYRVRSKITGRPDIVFPGASVVIFVDGCFWHGCPEHAVSPKTNARFWRQKISRNIERDREVTARLEGDGWTVLRYWEHQVAQEISAVVSDITAHLGE